MYLLEIKRILIYTTETTMLKGGYQLYCPHALTFKMFQQSCNAFCFHIEKISLFKSLHTKKKSENIYSLFWISETQTYRYNRNEGRVTHKVVH